MTHPTAPPSVYSMIPAGVGAGLFSPRFTPVSTGLRTPALVTCWSHQSHETKTELSSATQFRQPVCKPCPLMLCR